MKKRLIFISYIILGWVILSMMSIKAMSPGKCYGQTDDSNMSIPTMSIPSSSIIPMAAIIPDTGLDKGADNMGYKEVATPALSPTSATSPDSAPGSTTLSTPCATSSGASIPYVTDDNEPTDAGIYTGGIYPTAAGGLANSAWPCRGHDVRHTGQSPYIGAQTNSLKWSYKLGGGAHQP
jgi:hypothetical protein